MNKPIIQRKTKHPGFVHANDLILLPANTPYGNLIMKFMKIITRIDKINSKIEATYKSYENAFAKRNEIGIDMLEHQFFAEEVIYWLRKTADELIALFYVCNYNKKQNKYPSKIKIQKIDDLLKNKDSELSVLLSNYLPTLELLNKISNAFKHSFVNTDLNIFGAEEPTVPVLELLHNNLVNKINFYNVSFAQIITDFKKFYNFMDSQIRLITSPSR